MTTVAVTCKMINQSGIPIEGATLTAEMTKIDIYQGFIIPKNITTITNAEGEAVMDLWPNSIELSVLEYHLHTNFT